MISNSGKLEQLGREGLLLAENEVARLTKENRALREELYAIRFASVFGKSSKGRTVHTSAPLE